MWVERFFGGWNDFWGLTTILGGDNVFYSESPYKDYIQEYVFHRFYGTWKWFFEIWASIGCSL
jgi:hypothetical protein